MRFSIGGFMTVRYRVDLARAADLPSSLYNILRPPALHRFASTGFLEVAADERKLYIHVD